MLNGGEIYTQYHAHFPQWMPAFMRLCHAADTQLAASSAGGKEQIMGQSHYEVAVRPPPSSSSSSSFRLSCLITLICSNRITLPVFALWLHRWLHSVYFSFICNKGLPRRRPQNDAAVPESGAGNLRGKAKRWRKLEIHNSLPCPTV